MAAVHSQEDGGGSRLYHQICLDPEANHVPGEFFRDARVSGKGDCRSVVSCSNGGLSFLRCPTGLHFDIEERKLKNLSFQVFFPFLHYK
jgi:hypothetical protein